MQHPSMPVPTTVVRDRCSGFGADLLIGLLDLDDASDALLGRCKLAFKLLVRP